MKVDQSQFISPLLPVISTDLKNDTIEIIYKSSIPSAKA